MSDANALAKPGMRAIPLYQPDVDDCAIDLSDNTNLWGPPPAALRALQEVAAGGLSRYPSIYSERLRPAILDYVGLSGADGISLVAGCGSDDVIDSTMRAFGGKGDRIAFSSPTFSMIPVFARLNGLECDSVPLLPDYDIDAERLVSCGAKITYLCTPNNPTATEASRAAIEYVVDRAAGVVLIDAAYAEFTSEQYDALVRRSDRLLVAHTFSKAFGLAGLRMGYGVGAANLIELVTRARGPYKVNAMAERAVAAALNDSEDGVRWVRARAHEAVEVRQRLTTALQSLGLNVLPSGANFVMVTAADGASIFRELRERGILVRLIKGLPLDRPALTESGGVALRIGVGPWPMMETLLAALREILACA